MGMTSFSKEMVEKALARKDYEPESAARVATRLEASDADIRGAAWQWLSEETEPQMSAEGWSVSRLEKEFRMNAIAALLTIDWLRKEPGKALAALNEGFK